MDKENKRNRIYRWLNNKQYIQNTKQYNNIQIKEKKVILNTTEKKTEEE